MADATPDWRKAAENCRNAAQATLEACTAYQAFIKENWDEDDYLHTTLGYEGEVCEKVLACTAQMLEADAPNGEAAVWRGELEGARQFYDGEGNGHPTKHAEAYKDLRERIKQGPQRTALDDHDRRLQAVRTRLINTVTTCLGTLPEPEVEDHAYGESGLGIGAGLQEDGGGSSYGKPPTNEDACCDRLTSALSRLQGQQGGGSAPVIEGRGPIVDFARMLDRDLYTTLGIPALRSETALRYGADALAAKLLKSLGGSVVKVERDGASHFTFQPSQARLLSLGQESRPLGAQAVVAETVDRLRPVIMAAVNVLESEPCFCDAAEMEDIHRDIEQALTDLAAEARVGSGIFHARARALLEQVFRDTALLAYVSGVPRRGAFRAGFEGQLSQFWNQVERTLDIDRRPAGFDIVRIEEKVQALKVVLHHLVSIRDLIEGGAKWQGPIIVRLQAIAGALPPACEAARISLFAAEVAETDRRTIWIDDPNRPGSVIDLERFLNWVETFAANEFRPVLMETGLSRRELINAYATMRVQAETLRAALDQDFPTINDNPYAQGRRELREVADYLDRAVDLIEEVIGSGPAGKVAMAAE